MIAGRCSKTVAFVAILALTTFGALATASAQPADIKAIDGPSGVLKDVVDLHAWCEVYLPGAGWVGLDATSGLMTGEGHVPLACTPDPSSAAPITGAVDPCEVEFGFEMSVRRIVEQPRVTKPYDEADWQEILTAGHAIDARLQAGDVRRVAAAVQAFEEGQTTA